MCGIYGWDIRVGEELTDYQRFVLTLTLAEDMELRGRDSHGGALWPIDSDDHEPVILKALGKITETGQALLEESTKCNRVIVHTRSATVGAVTVENSHPFDVGDVIGVHNGSIFNYHELNDTYDRKFDVDSQHLLAHINDGIDLEELDGQGTTIFVRKSDECAQLWGARSDSGSFAVGQLYRTKSESEKKNGHYIACIFASTEFTIKKAADRMGLAIKLLSVPKSLYFYIEDGTPTATQVPFTLAVKPTVHFRREMGGQTNSVARLVEYNDKVNERDIASLVYKKPLADNIKDPRLKCFVGGGAIQPICPTCFHWLSVHITGFCTSEECKQESVCKSDLPLCDACGCYLITGVHRQGQINAKHAWCNTCNQDCTEAGRESKHDRKAKRKLAKSEKQKSLLETVSTDDDSDTPLFHDECAMCKDKVYVFQSRKIGLCVECRIKFGVNLEIIARCTEVSCTSPLVTEAQVLMGLCEICLSVHDEEGTLNASNEVIKWWRAEHRDKSEA